MDGSVPGQSQDPGSTHDPVLARGGEVRQPIDDAKRIHAKGKERFRGAPQAGKRPLQELLLRRGYSRHGMSQTRMPFSAAVPLTSRPA